MRSPTSFFVFVLLSACGPRLIKLPQHQRLPATGQFSLGVNAGTRLLDYEVPQVKVSGQRSAGITIKGFGSVGRQRIQQQRDFTVKRGAQGALPVSCEAVQEGSRVMGRDFTRHTYRCSGTGFELMLEESKNDVFLGAAKVNGVALELQSTDEMEAGPPQGPSGFHLRRNGRWVGSFEYFQTGNAYLPGDLSSDERDAVLTAMLVVQCTNLWLAKDADQNSSSGSGAFGL